jgi:hypothetical protein
VLAAQVGEHTFLILGVSRLLHQAVDGLVERAEPIVKSGCRCTLR